MLTELQIDKLQLTRQATAVLWKGSRVNGYCFAMSPCQAGSSMVPASRHAVSSQRPTRGGLLTSCLSTAEHVHHRCP